MSTLKSNASVTIVRLKYDFNVFMLHDFKHFRGTCLKVVPLDIIMNLLKKEVWSVV